MTLKTNTETEIPHRNTMLCTTNTTRAVTFNFHLRWGSYFSNVQREIRVWTLLKRNNLHAQKPTLETTFFVLFQTMILSCTLQFVKSAYQGIRWWFNDGWKDINTFSGKVSFLSSPFTDPRTPSRIENCLSCITLKNNQITFLETQEWWALSWKQTNKLVCAKVAMSDYLNWRAHDKSI